MGALTRTSCSRRSHKEVPIPSCRLPLEKIIEPAVFLAREGVRINRLQKFINGVLQPIIDASPEATAMASPMFAQGRLAEIGEFIFNPDATCSLEGCMRSSGLPMVNSALPATRAGAGRYQLRTQVDISLQGPVFKG